MRRMTLTFKEMFGEVEFQKTGVARVLPNAPNRLCLCGVVADDYSHIGMHQEGITACGIRGIATAWVAAVIPVNCPGCVAELLYRSLNPEAAKEPFGIVTHPLTERVRFCLELRAGAEEYLPPDLFAALANLAKTTFDGSLADRIAEIGANHEVKLNLGAGQVTYNSRVVAYPRAI